MYEIKEVKCEFSMDTKKLCQVCLSRDRKLYPLAEYTQIYQIICNIHQPISETLLCWECRMLLKKVIIFKNKVELAQAILKINNEQIPKTILSNLKIVKTDNIIKIEHNYSKNDNLKNVVIETKIKDEINDNDYDQKNFKDQDIKNDAVIKKEIDDDSKIVFASKRSVHYKLVKSGVKAKSKKIKIKPNEVKEWTANERCNEFYKNFKYKCVNCLCGWNLRKSYLKHNKKFHNEANQYVCDICTSRFASKMKLLYHMSRHYTARQCCSCGYRCYNATNMTHHLRMHLRCVQCSYCGAKFVNCGQFFAHYKSIHREFICDHCGSRFTTKHRLEKHMILHADVHECLDCNKRYKTLKALRSHRVFHHTVSRTDLSYCAPCDRQFNNVATYRRHFNTSVAHAKERADKERKLFPCPQCANVYTRNHYMRNHYTLVHMKQSKHYCVDCDKQFFNRHNFMFHRKHKHEGIPQKKNKLCNICGRGFSTKNILINHVRTHTGERPFSCGQCPAKFAQKVALDAHLKGRRHREIIND